MNSSYNRISKVKKNVIDITSINYCF